MKSTVITNVLTFEKIFFRNEFNMEYNLITYIMLIMNLGSQLHNEQQRKKILNNSNLDYCISKLTNKGFIFCEDLNLHASYEE